MDKFKWGATLLDSPDQIHVMYRGATTVGYVNSTSGSNGLVYDVFMLDFDMHRWQHIGSFPTCKEAKAAVETLAPLYWRGY